MHSNIYHLLSFLGLFKIVHDKNVYMTKGKELYLTCPGSPVNSWQNIKTQDTIATCENYAQNISPNLSFFSKLDLSWDCFQIGIANFTGEEFQDVQCHTDADTYKFSIIVNVIPNVSIEIYPSPVVNEGKRVELICKDKSGENTIFEWKDQRLRTILRNSSTLNISHIDRNQAGEYKCIGKNPSGQDTDIVNITVLYAPVIQSGGETFYGTSRTRELVCKAHGTPHILKFGKWKHYSQYNQLIRTLTGFDNGTLRLPDVETLDSRYEDTGFYECRASNGITDNNNNKWQTGRINVMIKDKPVLAKPYKVDFYGQFGDKSTMTMTILSSTNVIDAKWHSKQRNKTITTPCTPDMVKADFYNRTVDVNGYRCMLVIANTTMNDFSVYNVSVRNNVGGSYFEIKLSENNSFNNGKSDTPCIIKMTASTDHVKLLRKSTNVGNSHYYIIGYKKKSDMDWKNKSIQTTADKDQIDGLDSDTEYTIRISTNNVKGQGDTTTECMVKTKAYRCMIVIANTTLNDFSVYRALDNNNVGCSLFEINLSEQNNVNNDKLVPTIQYQFDNSVYELSCVVNESSDRYTYTDWEHRTDVDDHIRYIPAHNSDTLVIPLIKDTTNQHNYRGVYICRVLRNVHGKIYSSENFYLNHTGLPYFASSTEINQFIGDGFNTWINLYVVSHPMFTDIDVYYNSSWRLNNVIYKHKQGTVYDKIYGRLVRVQGYHLMLQLPLHVYKENRNNYHTYTVSVSNPNGTANFTVNAITTSLALSIENKQILRNQHKVEMTPGIEEETKDTKYAFLINNLAVGILAIMNVTLLCCIIAASRRNGGLFCPCGPCGMLSRGNTLAQHTENRSDPLTTIQSQYDEIDSAFYMPARLVRTSFINDNNPIDNTAEEVTYQDTTIEIHEVQNSQILNSSENNSETSSSSSSKESYMVPGRPYEDLNPNVDDHLYQITQQEDGEDNVNRMSPSLSSGDNETGLKMSNRYENLVLE